MAWTKTPPTQHGFYWFRDQVNEPSVAEGPDEYGDWMIIGDDRMPSAGELLAQGGEWWTEPLRPPEL